MKRLRVILGLLLLGVIANVAVAWGLHIRSNYQTIWVLMQRVYPYGMINIDVDSDTAEAAEQIPRIWYGWPMASLKISADYPRFMEAPTSLNNGIRVNNLPRAISWYREVRLPIQPVWIGFIANTFYYAAILWLIINVPFSYSRMIRRKRGLCVKCAYDLRGVEHETCPECGADVARVCSVSSGKIQTRIIRS